MWQRGKLFKAVSFIRLLGAEYTYPHLNVQKPGSRGHWTIVTTIYLKETWYWKTLNYRHNTSTPGTRYTSYYNWAKRWRLKEFAQRGKRVWYIFVRNILICFYTPDSLYEYYLNILCAFCVQVSWLSCLYLLSNALNKDITYNIYRVSLVVPITTCVKYIPPITARLMTRVQKIKVNN